MTDKLNPNQQPELSERDAELLSAYIDDMLPANEHQALEARLENNPFLRQELETMRQTVAWVNALPTLKAPRDFTISGEDVAPVARKVIPMPRQNWWFAASAAAIVIVLLGFVAILPNLSNQAPAGDGAFEQVAIANTNPAEERETENLAYDAEDGAEADFAESAPVAGGMSVEAPPAPEVTDDMQPETQAQAPADINSRSSTTQPTSMTLEQDGIMPTNTASVDLTEPQEAVVTGDMPDVDESADADTAPNANIASVVTMDDESASDDTVEEAEDLGIQESELLDTFEISPEEQSIEVILSILEAFRRFLEALQG